MCKCLQVSGEEGQEVVLQTLRLLLNMNLLQKNMSVEARGVSRYSLLDGDPVYLTGSSSLALTMPAAVGGARARRREPPERCDRGRSRAGARSGRCPRTRVRMIFPHGMAAVSPQTASLCTLPLHRGQRGHRLVDLSMYSTHASHTFFDTLV